MIDYELAKELKEAGFPYKGSYLSFYIDGVLSQDYRLPSGESIIYIPTLSELIEACGDESVHMMLTNECHGWDAWADIDKGGCLRMGEAGADIECKGKTPEVAVAKLWLALNKVNKD